MNAERMDSDTRCMYLTNAMYSENPVYKEIGCEDCDGWNTDCDHFHPLSRGLEDLTWED